MESFFLRTRFALVAAVSLALFVGGLVSGSAGAALIVGRENSAGSSTTSLGSNTPSEPVLFVRQEGAGTAVRAVAEIGIAGFFSSSDGAGVSGVVANSETFGVYAANDSESPGSGAALRASAAVNPAISATSGSASPIHIAGPIDRPPMVVNSTIRVSNLHADGVDGWSVGCPAETILTASLCFEAKPRSAASVYEAAETCHSASRSGAWQFVLPTALQLRTVRDDPGLDLSADGEHTDSLHGTSDGIGTLVVFPGGQVEQASLSEPLPYRCVTMPLWPDVAMETSE